MTPARLIEAIDQVWSTAAEHTRRAPGLHALAKVCRELYPVQATGMFLDIALHDALQRLGFGERTASPAPQSVSAAIHNAALAPGAVRQHFCPLDAAGDIPDLAFGPNRVCRFSEAELEALVVAAPVDPYFRARFDAKRLSQFRWLVVEEPYEVARTISGRHLPMFFRDWSSEMGSIEPHPPLFVPAVEAAICFLLTAPWEELVEGAERDWRAFRIPWVLTLDSDLFSPSTSVPDPETLTWIPYYIQDDQGDVVDEIEVPDTTSLDDSTAVALADFDHRSWTRFLMARSSAMMPGPITHFFVRAFTSNDVDEFLFHITTIEACLGQSKDHQDKKQRLPDGSNGATARTAWRVSALLNDWSAGPEFKRLFKERSQFVHGESMTTISASSRSAARSLARRCVGALIQQAPSNQTSREAFLRTLLDRRPATP